MGARLTADGAEEKGDLSAFRKAHRLGSERKSEIQSALGRANAFAVNPQFGQTHVSATTFAGGESYFITDTNR